MVWGDAHREVADELAEWWEDVCQDQTDKRLIMVRVPAGWGRTSVLTRFRRWADEAGPSGLVAWIDGAQPNRQAQAQAIRAALALSLDRSDDAGLAARAARQVAGLLDLNKGPGQVQLGLGLAGLFSSGMAMAASLLAASLAVTAAGNAWDASVGGEQGLVARTARELAVISVQIPAVVIIDDGDCLDVALALALIRNLASHPDGQVLVVVAAAPGGALARALAKEPGPELAGRIAHAEANPVMDYAERAELACQLLPNLPPAGTERIARQTRTFADVFAVTGSGRLTELGLSDGAAEVVAMVDTAAAAALERTQPPAEAVVVAWAGGALHAAQARAAAQVQKVAADEGDPRLVQAGSVVQLAGPADDRLRAAADNLPHAVQRQLAAALLREATTITSDPDAGVIERVIARQAAHRVRAFLANRTGLTACQVALARGLEQLGDPAAALDVITTAQTELPSDADPTEKLDLAMARLRLAQLTPGEHTSDPAVQEAVDLALAGGAAIRLEARVWATVDLLRTPTRRTQGLVLARQTTDAMDRLPHGGETAAQWRLLLGFHTGRAGDHTLAQRILAPVITRGTTSQQQAAHAVLRAITGPLADIRLQITFLQAELDLTPSTATQDLLRLHAALAASHGILGEFPQALHHAHHELPLRQQLQGPDHPLTLILRGNIAFWTGQCGDAAQALHLYQDLLPDIQAVLGPRHPDTLTTRGNIAFRTGQCGGTAQALYLYQDLLPAREAVLGPRHPDTLVTRSNIAFWTEQCGDTAQALHLARGLLPDLQAVLGPRHPDTLITRSNIASWTGQCGDAAQALHLFQDLLPDQQAVLGPRHPDTLTIRSNIAGWTGESGDAAQALHLFQDLLPDQQAVLGPRHPSTLITRSNIASWTGQCGNTAQALHLYQDLLPDQEAVLGLRHPDTLATRSNIAARTGQSGDTGD
jgi:hypothetical protein